MKPSSMQKKKESFGKHHKKSEALDVSYVENNLGDYIDAARTYLLDKQPDDALFDMDELNELLAGVSAHYAIERAFYGYDFIPNTDIHKEAFNPNRDYFFFNGYGNLVSVDSYDIEDALKYLIESMDDFVAWLDDNGYED